VVDSTGFAAKAFAPLGRLRTIHGATALAFGGRGQVDGSNCQQKWWITWWV